jgi:hypothetical protein
MPKLNLSMQEEKSLLSDLYTSKVIAQYNYILAFIPKKLVKVLLQI